jgi:hypothetical protein
MRAPPAAEFCFPADATAPVAARFAQVVAAAAPALLPYAAGLDTCVEDAAAPSTESLQLRPPRRRFALPWHRWPPTARLPRWTGDVVVVGECARAAELELMARLVEALLRADRRVLYLSLTSREHAAMQRSRRAAGWSSRFTLARLSRGGPRRQFRWHRNARLQLWRDWRALQPLLAASRAVVPAGARATLQEIALARVQWAMLGTRLHFHSAVTRTKFRPLSAALLADCLTNQRLSISLQHSIITCPGSFTPLLAKRYLCFGEPSRALLHALSAPHARGDLLAAGGFLDPLPTAPAQRAPGTVVVVDQTSDWSRRYFGGGRAAHAALCDVVPHLTRLPAVQRVIVRLHPAGNSQAVWQAVAAAQPQRVELRGGDRALADDLQGAAAVVGLFSTVLPTAAAAGIPTFFVWQPGWFSTPDLAPFAAQFVTPAALPGRIEHLLSDAAVFASECADARAAGAAYFHDGRMCDFSPALVEAMLAPIGASSAG